jgi:hypothetical protein
MTTELFDTPEPTTNGKQAGNTYPWASSPNASQC